MRLRRRKDTKQRLLEDRELVVLDPRQHKGAWSRYFGNDNPIHVELGMGKGKFISELSAGHPDINFIGIDMYDELIRKASEKARSMHEAAGREKPDNLALILANIERIEDIFAPDEIERIYLNHSDPWPKQRHAHRRLTHPNFVRKYANILNDRGEIHVKTDSLTLFEFSLNSFADMELRMRNITLDLHRNGTPPNHTFTEYEAKFVEQGMPIYRVEVLIGQQAIERHAEELNRSRRAAEAATGAEAGDPAGEAGGQAENRADKLAARVD